ncbi:MAG: glycine betaine ABC transporter substrate-binding protein [Salibacteraceae bacterium]
MKHFLSIFLIAIATITITLQSCETATKSIVIGNESWDVNRSLTYLTKAVLEKKGFDVKIKNQGIEKIFSDLNNGSIDLYMDAWENAHYVYIYEHPGLEDLDEIYTGCQMGVAVPSYFDVDSLSHLKADSSAYDNIFYGLKRNAGVMISATAAFKNYNMKPKVVAMEEDELMNQLQIMYDKEENFIVSAWKPHWKIKHFDLKFLTDTSNSFGESEDIHVYGKPGFKSENPEVAEIVSRMFLTDDQLTELLLLVKEEDNEEGYQKAASVWIENNRSAVDSWIK